MKEELLNITIQMHINYQIFKNIDYRMLIMYNVHQHGEQDDL